MLNQGHTALSRENLKGLLNILILNRHWTLEHDEEDSASMCDIEKSLVKLFRLILFHVVGSRFEVLSFIRKKPPGTAPSLEQIEDLHQKILAKLNQKKSCHPDQEHSMPVKRIAELEEENMELRTLVDVLRKELLP